MPSSKHRRTLGSAGRSSYSYALVLTLVICVLHLTSIHVAPVWGDGGGALRIPAGSRVRAGRGASDGGVGRLAKQAARAERAPVQPRSVLGDAPEGAPSCAPPLPPPPVAPCECPAAAPAPPPPASPPPPPAVLTAAAVEALARHLHAALGAITNTDLRYVAAELAVSSATLLLQQQQQQGVGGGGAGAPPAPIDADAAFTAAYDALTDGGAGGGSAPADALPPLLVAATGGRTLPPAELAAALLEAEAGEPAGVAPPDPVPPEHALALPDGRVVDGRFTHQTCYLDGDEGELCVLQGTVCFDGDGPVVVTPDAPDGDADTGAPAQLEDPHADCVDTRHYEASSFRWSGCQYSGPRVGARGWPYAGRRAPRPATDHPVELSTRGWGPTGRGGLRFRELRPEGVFPDPARGWASVGVGEGAAAPPPTGAPGLPGLPLLATHAPGGGGGRRRGVAFTPDPLWVLPTPPGAAGNPYMWLTAVAPLFAARRANASGGWGAHPNDGFLHPPPSGRHAAGAEPAVRPLQPSPNMAGWVTGRQWGPLPPQGTLLFVGPGAAAVPSAAALRPWMAAALSLAAQPGARAYLGDARAALNGSSGSGGGWGAGAPPRLLCSRTGVVPSLRPRVFAAPADAWVWRQYAHGAMGLREAGAPLPHAPHPPAAILLLDRHPASGRGFANLAAVLRVLRATGLPVRHEPALGELPPAQQAAAFAGAGLVVAPHGAALANLVFAPSHAALIEVFPPLMTSGVYARLAGAMGVRYAAVHTTQALGAGDLPPGAAGDPSAAAGFADPAVAAACANVSSLDAFLVHACNGASKRHPLLVPPRVLARAVADALDAIGVAPARAGAAGGGGSSHPRAGSDPDWAWDDDTREEVRRYLQVAAGSGGKRGGGGAPAAAG